MPSPPGSLAGPGVLPTRPVQGVGPAGSTATMLASGVRLATLELRAHLRGPSVLLALGLMAALTALYLPPHGAPYLTLSVGGARGYYSSVWVGTTVALLSSTVCSLIGFFLCRGALEADRRVGQERWTEATPLPPFFRLLGKALCGFAHLALLCLTVALSAPLIQRLRGEDMTLNALELWSPTLLLTLPTLFGVAVLAVAFDRLRWLRGAPGAGLFVLLWTGAVGLSVAGGDLPDPLGAGLVLHALREAAPSSGPGHAELTLGLSPAHLPPRFVWQGVAVWPAGYLLSRVASLALGVGLLYAVSRLPLEGAAQARRRATRRPDWPGGTGPVWAELNLALSSVHPGLRWALPALALGGVLSPLALPFILLALLPLHATLCSAADRHGMAPLLTSLPGGGRSLLAGRGLALWTLSTLCLCPGVLALLLGGQVQAAVGWLIWPLLSAALALSTCALSRGSTLFEAVFLALWYLGPISGWPALDLTHPPVALGALGLSAALIGWTAALWRLRRRRGQL